MLCQSCIYRLSSKYHSWNCLRLAFFDLLRGKLFSKGWLRLAVRELVNCRLFKHRPRMRATFCSLKGKNRWGREETMISFARAQGKCRLSSNYRGEIESHCYTFYKLLESFDTDNGWEGINAHYNYYMQASLLEIRICTHKHALVQTLSSLQILDIAGTKTSNIPFYTIYILLAKDLSVLEECGMQKQILSHNIYIEICIKMMRLLLIFHNCNLQFLSSPFNYKNITKDIFGSSISINDQIVQSRSWLWFKYC